MLVVHGNLLLHELCTVSIRLLVVLQLLTRGHRGGGGGDGRCLIWVGGG